jgi:hypothetical protein
MPAGMTNTLERLEHAQYVISAREIIWGTLLIAVTLVLHALGMITTLRASRALRRRMAPMSGFFRGMRLLIVASWMIVLSHLIEVMVWAAFFTWRGALPSWSEANYYALLQYTTVGSDTTLSYDWRLLAGMLPMAGMLTFAWSTAVLLDLAVSFAQAQMQRMDAHGSASADAPDPERSP